MTLTRAPLDGITRIMSHGLVLHPAAALVDRAVGDAGYMEGVGDAHRMGEMRREPGAIGVGEV